MLSGYSLESGFIGKSIPWGPRTDPKTLNLTIWQFYEVYRPPPNAIFYEDATRELQFIESFRTTFYNLVTSEEKDVLRSDEVAAVQKLSFSAAAAAACDTTERGNAASSFICQMGAEGEVGDGERLHWYR